MSHTNPDYIGPGYWASFHRKARYADTKDKKEEVLRSIVQDIDKFPCNNCRTHAIKYLKDNPISETLNNNNKYSLFFWTVNFHNSVNKRLGKEIVEQSRAILMWSDEEVCFEKKCGDSYVSNEDEIKKNNSFLLENY